MSLEQVEAQLRSNQSSQSYRPPMPGIRPVYQHQQQHQQHQQQLQEQHQHRIQQQQQTFRPPVFASNDPRIRAGLQQDLSQRAASIVVGGITVTPLEMSNQDKDLVFGQVIRLELTKVATNTANVCTY